SQLISERKSRIELEAEVKSLKSNIKTLKRELTLAQKASSANNIKILSLETKVRELEGKLEDIDLERTYHGLDTMGGMIEDPAQINSSDPDPKENDSLRLELGRVKEDLNSKEYTIECMEKGIEALDNIYKRELDIRSSERLKMMEENRSLRDQLASKKNTSSEIISDTASPGKFILRVGIAKHSGDAKVVPLSQEMPLAPVTIPAVMSSLMSPMGPCKAPLAQTRSLLFSILIIYRMSTGASGTSSNLF
ncbi:hypothetical protein C1645_832326, partial [Glomus cerebriforme]